MKRIEMKKYRHFIIILLIVVTLFLVDYFLFSLAIVKGESMFPTIKDGDRLIYIKSPCLYKDLKKGDIIIFHAPEKSRKAGLFIKRIIATEGESYYIEDGVLRINNMEIRETYTCGGRYINKDYPYIEGVVPKNRIFVLGDNRNNSNDSRRFSCVGKKEVEGKALIRIWPPDRINIFTNPHN